MKLYDIPERSKIVCKVSDGSKYIIFDHIDGAYSYCETEKGGIVHLNACAELELYDGKKEKYKGFYQLRKGSD